MKEYKPKNTAASIRIRYALASMGAEATCAYVLLKETAGSVSYDRLSILIITFNLIAVMLRPLVGIFADRIENKHTGVRLGTLLIILGYYFPVSFGINAKIVILALGSCIFHSFAASSLLSREKGKSTGISIFLGGSAAGLAVFTFAPFLCHILTALLMACVIAGDTCEIEDIEDKAVKKQTGSAAVTAVSAALLLVSYMLLYYGYSSLSFGWAGFFKTKVIILFAIAFGRCLGGILSDKLGRLFVTVASALGGSAILVFCSDSKKLSLVALVLVSMPLGPMITALTKRSMKNSGFIFALFCAAAYLGQELTFYAEMKRPLLLLPIAVCAVLAVASAEVPEIIKLIKNEKEKKNEAS